MTTLPPNPHPAPGPEHDQLPPALQRDLLDLLQPRRAIPPDLDAELLAAARQKLLPRSKRPRLTPLLRIGGPLAAAAALALVAYVAWPTTRPAPAGPTLAGAFKQSKAESDGLAKDAPSPARSKLARSESALTGAALDSAASAENQFIPLPGDVNGDHVVDILDALALARAIRDNAASPFLVTVADLNHDGLLDRADIDAIASSAVSLAAHPAAGAKPAGPGGGT